MSTQIQRRRGTTTEHGSFTGAAGEITVDTTKDTLIVHDGSTAGGHPLATEANPRFTGDVGIGTDNPQSKLQVSENGGATIRLQDSSGNDGIHSALISADGTTALKLQASAGTTSKAITFFRSNTVEAMRIASDGNVGIRTSNPQRSLDVASDINRVAKFRSTTPSVDIELSDDTTTKLLAVGRIGDDLSLYTNDLKRLNISATGNVGIGTASPTAKLDVNGDATINSLTIGRGAGNIASNTATGYQALYSNTTGNNNVANGRDALYSNTTGFQNAANGRNALYSNTTGYSNTANGFNPLYSNTTGNNNVANGNGALYSNTTGSNNVANGYQALYANTTSANNTANGYKALNSNTTGNNNVANGLQALRFNTTGSSNTANGRDALYSNTTGFQNTANGYQALSSNTTGNYNTATGYRALYSTTTGVNNTANGRDALYSNTTGVNNTANGRDALYSNTTGFQNTANGFEALYSNTTGGNNTADGRNALYSNTTGSGNIGIGFINNAGAYAPVFNPTTENNRLVLGHTAITNAYVKVAWTVTSDERDKMNFAPVPYGLDFVNQLKPTAYQFKVDRDTETPNGDVRYGFKAQDILALEGDNPVIIDTEDADHLKYKGEHLVPVLVNAVQELTAIVKELQAEIKTLKG